MKTFEVREIGTVTFINEEICLHIHREYRKALTGIDGFSHLVVTWWCDQLDHEEMRQVLETPKPYRMAPDVLGIFATRSPMRPNPIALNSVQITHVDIDEGNIYIAYIDAFEHSPILDIKPYTPSIDRINEFHSPNWCAHWPKSYEESGDFDWSQEFNFPQ